MGHAPVAFFEGRDRERVGKRQWRAGWGLEEELMGYATVFVFVASTLTHVLREGSLDAISCGTEVRGGREGGRAH